MRKALTSVSVRREIYDLFLDDDPVVAMRASYVAMKVAHFEPATTDEFKKLILYIKQKPLNILDLFYCLWLAQYRWINIS